MKLESLCINIDEKEIRVEFDSSGISVNSDSELTLNEMQCTSAAIFLYLGTKIKNIVISNEALTYKANQLYLAFQEGNYQGMKNIEEMSLEEFNEEVKRWETSR